MLEVSVRQRHERSAALLHVDHIFDCTSPSTTHSERLFVQLMRGGIVSSNAQSLRVDETYRVIAPDGSPHAALMYIGPQLKNRLWEATAIPELRSHARHLASSLAEVINKRNSQ